jgi:alpha-tubulin suppressor-like RCC1 family protein
MLSVLLLGCQRDQPAGRDGDDDVTSLDTSVETGVSADDTSETGRPPDTPPVSLTWQTVDVGIFMSCGIASDGTVRCWGVDDVCIDQAPHPPEVLSQLSVGGTAGCGLRPDGSLRCWCCTGVGSYPEICDEAPAGTFSRVEVGAFTACAQDAAGILHCWGADAAMGIPPVDPVGDFAMEAEYSVAVRLDGTVVKWGNENWGAGEKPPQDVVFVDISAGRRHACGLDVDGVVHCWGQDTFEEPWPPPPPGSFAQIETFNSATCVIDAFGTATCWWGADLVALEIWTQQMPALPFAQIGLGEWDGCGVTTAGEAYCWGGDPQEEPWLDVPGLNP